MRRQPYEDSQQVLHQGLHADPPGLLALRLGVRQQQLKVPHVGLVYHVQSTGTCLSQVRQLSLGLLSTTD